VFRLECVVHHGIIPSMQGNQAERDSRMDTSIFFGIDSRSGDISFAPQIAFDHGNALHSSDIFSFAGPDFMEREKQTGVYQAHVDTRFFYHVAGLLSLYARCIEQLPRLETTVFPYRLIDLVFLSELSFSQIT